MFDFASGAFVFVCFLELCDCVIILIGQLPPLGAKLTYVAELILFEAVVKSCQFFIDLQEVL